MLNLLVLIAYYHLDFVAVGSGSALLAGPVLWLLLVIGIIFLIIC